MKNKILYLFILLGSLLASCEDFLEEENKSQVVADEFYGTEEGYESLVNACYATLRDIYRGDHYYLFNSGVDILVEGKNPLPEGITQYHTLTSEDEDVEAFYDALYKAIQLCNSGIYYSGHTESTDQLIARKGELQFLRANYYFLLVQSFGGVALVEDMVQEALLNFERQSAEQVYDFIVAELEEALSAVPEVAEEKGRVYKRAVRHLLAKVYLTRGWESFGQSDDFSKAAQYADQAINGQLLNLTHEEVFTPGNEDNEEIIFAVEYSAGSMEDLLRDGNLLNRFYLGYYGGEGEIYGYPFAGGIMPSQFLYDLYTEYDARWHSTFLTTVYERVYDYWDQPASEWDNLPVQLYFPHKWEVADTAAWRAVNPAGRSETRIIPYGPEWEANNFVNNARINPGIKKFLDPNSAFSQYGSGTRDIFLQRLAETYLIAAEAYLKAGDVATATDRINEVRKRAAVEGHEADMEVSSSSVDIDFILDERGRELVGELLRWFDLKRTGKLVERTQLYNRDIKSWFDQGINPFMGQDGNLKILRPIPRKAIDLNKAGYSQNPGYTS